MKTKTKIKCVWCKKEFTTKSWVQKDGALKGYNIIEKCTCTKKCEKAVDDMIKTRMEELNHVEG